MSLKAAAVGAAAGVLRRAPGPLEGPLAAALAPLLFATVERRAALASLERAFPDWPRARRWRTALGAYRQMSRSLLEFLHTDRLTDAEFVARVHLENEEALAAAHAEGGGVVVVTGHFGNWEWLARRAAVAYPVAVVTKEPRDPAIAARLRALREAAGLATIDHEDVRAALRWLREGGVLGIVMDQEPARPEDGAVAPLLGRPTLTHVGPFRLARRAGAPVLTIFLEREAPGRYRGRFEPLALSAREDPPEALAEDAAAFNARLEREIRARPDHWLWMYGRWRRLEKLYGSGSTEASASAVRAS